MTSSPAMTPQQREFSSGGLGLYRKMAVGEASLPSWLYYELSLLFFSGLPGIFGYASRSMFYPRMFRHAGKRPAFGRDVTIRNPGAISIGSKLLVDDFAVLDARGPRASIELGDHVSLGRYSSIVSKEAEVFIGNAVNIGSHCRIASQSRVSIGESTLVAAYAYIGPGNHQQGDGNHALIEQPMDIKGGVVIGAHAWIGARSTILDGVTIGDNAIVGAHSLVREDVPANAIVAGVPAKILKIRP